jgi:hypothetical protein
MCSLFHKTICTATAAILLFAAALQAQQRNYVFGTSTDLATGSANSGRTNVVQQTHDEPLKFFYSVYPSLTMAATGGHSSLTASYVFGFEQMQTSPKSNSQSHGSTIALSSILNQKWNIKLSDSFEQTTDATTFNGIRGVTVADEGFRFLFYPVTTHLRTRSNLANFAVAYAVSDTSGLSFNAAHSYRTYGAREELFRRELPDQQVVSGTVMFTKRTSLYAAWTIAYRGDFSTFADFQNARTYGIDGGYSNRIAPDLTFGVTIGAARVNNSIDSYIGYNASANLQKKIGRNSFRINYAQTSGQASGLGSTSDNRSAGLAIAHEFRGANLFTDISAFDVRGTLDNSLNTRGVSGTASLAIPLISKLSIVGGAQYQRNTGTALYDFTQKRVFLSLRYTEPNLWRFAR